MKRPSSTYALMTVCALSAVIASTQQAQARDQLRIVGSSTVFPFTSAAAEQFGQGGKFKTPIVESTGTGGGFKLFCAGEGENLPDINNASRAMTESEKVLCSQNGINNVTELKIGYDGIVIANAKGGTQFNFTKKQIFMALANKLPKDGKLIDNPYKNWNEIDPTLKSQAIEVYGPPPTSGTRDAFVELVMEEGCKEFPEFTAIYSNEKERKKACGMIREDGAYITASEDDNIIIQKLVANKSALGIFGYSFLAENLNKVQGNKVGGVSPSFTDIENGNYKVSRSMFIYVKGEHIGKIPGVVEFANYMVSNSTIGPNGYLIEKGLLPLHAKDLKLSQERAASLKSKP
jgi:phosphate transport system substrate-binding protein